MTLWWTSTLISYKIHEVVCEDLFALSSIPLIDHSPIVSCTTYIARQLIGSMFLIIIRIHKGSQYYS